MKKPTIKELQEENAKLREEVSAVYRSNQAEPCCTPSTPPKSRIAILAENIECFQQDILRFENDLYDTEERLKQLKANLSTARLKHAETLREFDTVTAAMVLVKP